MKKKQKLFFIIILTLTMSIEFTNSSAANENSLNIICTNSILADFTSNIISDNVTIEFIMPAGVCPTHFDTSPSDVLKIINADIIISLGLEPWLDNLVNKSGNKVYSEIKCSNLGEWNIPTGAIAYVEKIRDELIVLLPNHKNSIQQNAEAYISEINNKSVELINKIKMMNYTNRKIISMEWQKDFLDYIGFNITYYYSPPQTLSVQDEIDVINAASKQGVSAIVDNLQSTTEFGARVASESGISHVIFTNFPGAVPGTNSYFDMITYNTDQLIKGLQSFDQRINQTKDLENTVSSLEFQRNLFIIFTIIACVICVLMSILYKRK